MCMQRRPVGAGACVRATALPARATGAHAPLAGARARVPLVEATRAYMRVPRGCTYAMRARARGGRFRAGVWPASCEPELSKFLPTMPLRKFLKSD